MIITTACQLYSIFLFEVTFELNFFSLRSLEDPPRDRTRHSCMQHVVERGLVSSGMNSGKLIMRTLQNFSKLELAAHCP